MSFEDIFGIATWGQLQFDPLRPRLYFSESIPDKRTNKMRNRIMMMDTSAASKKPIPLTAGPSDLRPVPSPNGEHLAFLSRRSGSSQIWKLPLLGGEPTQVTFIQGGVKTFTWSKNSQGLVAVAHVENGTLEREKVLAEPSASASDEELDVYFNRDVKHITHQYYKLDGEGFFDKGRDQLVWVPLEGEVQLLTNGYDHYGDPVFAPDGDILFCVHREYDAGDNHPGIVRVERYSLSSHEWSRLPLPDWSIGALQVSDDGKHLAFCASKPEEMGYGLTSLYRYDLTTGDLTDLSSKTDRSVGDESGSDVPANSTAKPVWRGDTILMLLSNEGRVMVSEFTAEVKPLWDAKRVVYDFAANDSLVALSISDPTHPSGIALVTYEATDETVEWAPVPWSEQNAPAAPEEIWAVEGDGNKVHTWCLRPNSEGPHPTLLEIHGGPMSMYGYRYFHEFQCLVEAGYAVVYTNPRGSVGYGRQFCDAIIGQWGDKDYRDVMAGLDAALSTWTNLDGGRLGAAGGSYGGFMVNWIVSHTNRFKAAVTMRSVVNRFSAMGSSDMGWLRIPQYGTKPWWEDPMPYWQQSPLRYASNIHTPLLIEHQENDYRLPIEQGEQLYSALKYLGRTVELVLYPNESHGMSRNGQPWHRVHRLKTNTAWLDRYLKS